MAFSLNWHIQRVAATAPIPSAPHTTGTRSPIARASSLAGFDAGGTSGPASVTTLASSSIDSSTSSAYVGTIPIASSAPSAPSDR